MLKTLSDKELEQVSGGSPAHVAGAVIGAIGGVFGAIIAGNSSSGSGATGRDILNGAIAGAIGGAASPIRAIHNIVVTAGTGIASGGVISLINEIKIGQAPN